MAAFKLRLGKWLISQWQWISAHLQSQLPAAAARWMAAAGALEIEHRCSLSLTEQPFSKYIAVTTWKFDLCRVWPWRLANIYIYIYIPSGICISLLLLNWPPPATHMCTYSQSLDETLSDHLHTYRMADIFPGGSFWESLKFDSNRPASLITFFTASLAAAMVDIGTSVWLS